MTRVFSLLIVLALISCQKDEIIEVPVETQFVGIATNENTIEIPEGNILGYALKIPIVYELDNTSDVSIGFTLNGTAELNKDFKISGVVITSSNTFEVTLRADTSVTIFELITIPNLERSSSENLVLEAVITDTPPEFTIDPALESSISLKILDDDCDFFSAEFVGIAETEDFISGNFNGAYSSEIKLIEGSTYQVSNFAASIIGKGVFLEFIIDDSDPINTTVDIQGQIFSAFNRRWSVIDLNSFEFVNTCDQQITFSTRLKTEYPTFEEYNYELSTTYSLLE